jgi:hypothetical protein
MGRRDYPHRGYLQPHKSSALPAETCARLIWTDGQRRDAPSAATLAVGIDPIAEVGSGNQPPDGDSSAGDSDSQLHRA